MKRAPALLLATLALMPGLPLAGALAQPAPRPVAVPSEAPSDAQIRKWVEENPGVIIQALNRYVEERKRAEQADSDKKTLSFSSELLDATNAPFIGRPDAKVTIAYVLDAECGYCKSMTPILDELVAKNPDVRIVHRWVKFLAPSSEYAARIAAILWKRYPASYPTYYRAVLEHKGRLGEEGVDKALDKAIGAEAALQVRAEARTGASRAEIDESVRATSELAHRAGIQGTPTFVVSGLGDAGIMRGAQQPEPLQAAADKARGVVKP